VTHHTWLRGADVLVDRAQADLATALEALIGRAGARIVENETCRLALRELVANTRANHPLTRCQRVLAGQLGEAGKGPTVASILAQLQADALSVEPRAATPLPLGVATPAPDGSERPTLVPDRPVVAHDGWTEDTRPTTSLPPKHTVGPWSQGQQPAKSPGKR
jgi:hypothetical protein